MLGLGSVEFGKRLSEPTLPKEAPCEQAVGPLDRWIP